MSYVTFSLQLKKDNIFLNYPLDKNDPLIVLIDKKHIPKSVIEGAVYYGDYHVSQYGTLRIKEYSCYKLASKELLLLARLSCSPISLDEIVKWE